MIQSAIDSGSHERLAAISARRSLIAEPEIRLELLQALDWFDETAAWDALDYLSDPDAAVAGTAAQIIIRRLPEEGNSQQRGNMYSAALIAMDDAADREMLLTLLDGESLLCCRQVMHKIEDSRHRYSELWNRLNGIYHEKSGHDYTNFVDELLRK